MLPRMAFAFDREEIGLIVLVTALFLLRMLFSPRRLVARLARRFPDRSPRRGWREWSWGERLVVGLSVALLVVLGVRNTHSVVSVVAGVGIAMVVVSIKGLLAARGRPE